MLCEEKIHKQKKIQNNITYTFLFIFTRRYNELYKTHVNEINLIYLLF